MAYMRGDPYVYSDGEKLIIVATAGGGQLTIDQAEELAAMIWHRMTPDQQVAALDRVVEHHAGNFGADGVMRLRGLPTVMDLVEQDLEQS